MDQSTRLPVLPDPDDMQGDFLVRPKNLVYTLDLRGQPELTREVINLEAESAESDALVWTA
jgi:hypothetical protein